MIFKKNKYTTPKIDADIKEKGFGVYNYITLRELLMTVQRDYLSILSKINLIFGIITIVLGILAFLSQNFLILIIFLLVVYGVIFTFLFIKLVKRSFYYLYISNVVYTNKGIILGNKLHLYSAYTDLEKKLLHYEELFDEFLSRPSRLEQIIIKKRVEVLEGTTENGKKALDVMGKFDLGRSKEGTQLAILGIVSYGIYTVLLYVFYYIGYSFGYVMFYFVSLFLRIIFYFKENTEIKIKQKIESIEGSFVKIKKIDEILSNRISSFKDGEISNIAHFVQENFSNFYSEILLILEKRTKLLKIIKNSKYKDFIDFNLLEKYIKIHFNKPVKEMIIMLLKFEKILEKGLYDIQSLGSNKTENNAHLRKKEINLITQLAAIKLNKTKLEKTIIL